MGKAKVSVSCVTKFKNSVTEEKSSATSLKSAVACVDAIVQKANFEINHKIVECEKNCNIALRTANEKLEVLQNELNDLQSRLAVTPSTITVSKPCGTDEEGNTVYEEVEEPNPEYYALLDQISEVKEKISTLKNLKSELQAKNKELLKAKQIYQDAVAHLNNGKKGIIACCDSITKKSDTASSQLQKAIAAIRKYLDETVHTTPVPSYTSINWQTYSTSQTFADDRDNSSALPDEPNDIRIKRPECSELNIPKTESIESINKWIREVNPNYYNRSIPNHEDYHVNCGSCALAVENRLSGNNRSMQASNINIPTDELMEKATGKTCKYMSVNEISRRLKEAGPGSHFIVGINRKPIVIGGKIIPQSGHWFNVYYDGKNIYTIEGQSGNVYEWPHDYGDISEWCALI